MSVAHQAVSVVICAYTEERWDDLIAAVASVRQQTLLPREIIVVVDHNPPLLAKVRSQIPGIIATDNRQTRGLSGARNSGIALAKGEIIAFMDEDAVAAPEWLAQLLKGYQDPNVLGVGGTIKPMWNSGQPAWFPEEFNWVVGCTYRGLPQRTAPIRNLIGCNMSFRRAEIIACGGFSSGIGQIGSSMLRCDDTEFCIRLQQQRPNAVFLYEPEATVYHRVPASRAQWAYFRSRCFTEGLAKFVVARSVGSQDGLSSERAYTLRTLPHGVVRGLLHTLSGRDFNGLSRAGAIVAGLTLTVTGYLLANISPKSVAMGQVEK